MTSGDGPMTESAHELADRLVGAGYAALLGAYPDLALAESLRNEPGIAFRLRDIVDDRRNPWQARFLASEFLFRHVEMLLQRGCDRASLQDGYFQALRHNYTGNAADWGFAKGPNDLGVLGRMVSGWGPDVRAFTAGLDDGTPLVMSFCWHTPSHFSPPYRVKDFAALIVAASRNMTLDLTGPPEERDKTIAGLKTALAAEG
jgi:hypothetical protein